MLVDSSINLLGKTLTAQVTGTFRSVSTIATPVPGITENTSINVTGGIAVLQPPAPTAITAPAPADLGTLHQGALLMNLETVMAAPTPAGKPTLFTPIAGTDACVLLSHDEDRCTLHL